MGSFKGKEKQILTSVFYVCFVCLFEVRSSVDLKRKETQAIV